MPGFIEELVVFGSSFFGPGLGSARSAWNRIVGDAFEHAADEFGLFARG
jgi:hypothetical protein